MSKHQEHHLHQNSLAAYWASQQSVGKRAKDILDAFARMKHPATDREILRHLGLRDMNEIRPRITELIDKGLVVEDGKAICPQTLKAVRTCRLKGWG